MASSAHADAALQRPLARELVAPSRPGWRNRRPHRIVYHVLDSRTSSPLESPRPTVAAFRARRSTRSRSERLVTSLRRACLFQPSPARASRACIELLRQRLRAAAAVQHLTARCASTRLLGPLARRAVVPFMIDDSAAAHRHSTFRRFVRAHFPAVGLDDIV